MRWLRRRRPADKVPQAAPPPHGAGLPWGTARGARSTEEHDQSLDKATTRSAPVAGEPDAPAVKPADAEGDRGARKTISRVRRRRSE